MDAHPNASIYRKATKLLAAGDIEEYLDYISDSILWWEIDSTEPVEGKTALRAHLQDLPDLSIKSEIHDILANDEHLVALIHAVGTTEDGEISLSYAEVIHFDGQLLAKRQVFPSNVRAAQAFFDID